MNGGGNLLDPNVLLTKGPQWEQHFATAFQAFIDTNTGKLNTAGKQFLTKLADRIHSTKQAEQAKFWLAKALQQTNCFTLFLDLVADKSIQEKVGYLLIASMNGTEDYLDVEIVNAIVNAIGNQHLNICIEFLRQLLKKLDEQILKTPETKEMGRRFSDSENAQNNLNQNSPSGILLNLFSWKYRDKLEEAKIEAPPLNNLAYRSLCKEVGCDELIEEKNIHEQAFNDDLYPRMLITLRCYDSLEDFLRFLPNKSNLPTSLSEAISNEEFLTHCYAKKLWGSPAPTYFSRHYEALNPAQRHRVLSIALRYHPQPIINPQRMATTAAGALPFWFLCCLGKLMQQTLLMNLLYITTALFFLNLIFVVPLVGKVDPVSCHPPPCHSRKIGNLP